MRVLLDVDTGTDDAVAIMLAALHPGLELAAVTTVNGNVPVQVATNNSLRVLDLIGRADIPVYPGAASPLARPDFPVPRAENGASGIHGEYLDIPEPVSGPADGIAALAILDEFREGGPGAGRTVLVAVGPLTNVALALKLDAGLAARIPKLVIMGGAHAIANVTASAEFNIWADPESASVVINSGIREIILVPLDATSRAPVSLEDCERFRALGTPAGQATARFVARRIAGYDQAGLALRPGTAPVHDALCVAYLVRPSVISLHQHHVGVETTGRLTVGRTVMDLRDRGRQPANAWVALDADETAFRDVLLAAFAAPVAPGTREKG